MIKVLVVDDSALVRKLFGRVSRERSRTSRCSSRATGWRRWSSSRAFRPDVITLDVQMPQMDGLDCLDRIMVERPCPVVMVSSLTAEGAEATLEALRLGAVDFVPSPTGAVSLRIDEFAPTLVDKDSRGGDGARCKSSARLRERVQLPHRRPRRAAQRGHGRRAPKRVAAAARIGRRPGARRHLDRRPAGARSPADAAAARLSLADPRRPAHARRPSPGRSPGGSTALRAQVVEVARPTPLEAGLRLYRPRRCRSRRRRGAPRGSSP